MRRLIVRLVLIFFIALPVYAHLPAVALAQAGLDAGFGPDLSLTLSPHYPAPRDVVRVVAHSTLIPLSEATVAW